MTTYFADQKLDIDEASEILSFEKSTAVYVEPDKKAVFFENADDVDNSTDYDFALVDSEAGSLELFVENFDFWDKLTEDIKAGATTKKLAIDFSDIPTEDELGSFDYGDLTWVDVSSITASDSSHGTVLTVVDDSLMTENIEIAFGLTVDEMSKFDYIGFYIATENVWAGEDFLLEDVFLV